jgi:ABC-type antimicrobial peptide transport system ATPase subunit
VDVARLPPGCSFHPRCPARFAPCTASVPRLEKIDGGAHTAACHLYSATPNDAAKPAGIEPANRIPA